MALKPGGTCWISPVSPAAAVRSAAAVTAAADVVGDDLAVRVVGVGRLAEPDRAGVLLLGEREVAEQPGGLLHPDHQHPGRHRVQRARVTDPAGAGQAADPGHDVVRGPAGWLVHDDQAVLASGGRPPQTPPRAIRSGRPSGRPSRLAPAPPGSRGGELLAQRGHDVGAPGRWAVNPAARGCPPPPSATQARPTSAAPLDRADTCHSAVVVLLEHHGHVGLVGAPQHVDDRLGGVERQPVRGPVGAGDRGPHQPVAPAAPARAAPGRAPRRAGRGSRTGRGPTARAPPRPGRCRSRAAGRPARCTPGEVVEYRNEPVSVTSPAYRPSAMSRETGTPSRPISSWASTAVAAAAGSIRLHRAEAGVGRVMIEDDQLLGAGGVGLEHPEPVRAGGVERHHDLRPARDRRRAG